MKIKLQIIIRCLCLPTICFLISYKKLNEKNITISFCFSTSGMSICICRRRHSWIWIYRRRDSNNHSSDNKRGQYRRYCLRKNSARQERVCSKNSYGSIRRKLGNSLYCKRSGIYWCAIPYYQERHQKGDRRDMEDLQKSHRYCQKS